MDIIFCCAASSRMPVAACGMCCVVVGDFLMTLFGEAVANLVFRTDCGSFRESSYPLDQKNYELPASQKK